MNSYPAELLTQLAPVMFIGGLDPPPASGKTTDPFVVLSHRLREALVNQRKVAIWQPEKKKTFQVILVDKDVKFPPRRLVPADHPDYPTAHSPLSPLTPSSPLYPDGLIAPIWIRKHTRLVPSVFVVFTRLFEHAPTTRAPLETAEADRDREVEERKRDTELCAEIAARKKTVSERGVKLTVVLLASRKLLDDPTLDGRLTFIRRQSGLDPRAALFVLSPVSQAEIGDFAHSLQEALYEPAIEYYTNHSKRVRRKRNRHSQVTSTYPVTQPIGSVPSRPLRPEGWTVRYEYKMACFAEFRGEDEVALKHYQDAYSSLVIMFGSTAILPPRTKRWAEAKVLADCINLKICKLYLYNDEYALALAHHNSHMRKFADFSRGWGIGEETFEFWSWLARQHRAFAELLEHGTRSTLKIPAHFPTSSSANAAAAAAAQAFESGQRGALELEAIRALGLNPSQALQHPGFYYYMSARCTERRRERFLSVARGEAEGSSTTAPPPGFSNEQKVDHLTLILELYTRAYDLFKAYTPKDAQGHGRLTLWIAYRIAHTYYESGKFDLAVRFFERIAKTYRREQWDSLLRPLLSVWYSCAQQMGDMGLSVRLLFEMLGHGIQTQDDDVNSTQEDILAVIKSSVPSSPEEPLVIDQSESEPILDSCAVFWRSDVLVGESVAFQLSLTSKTAVSLHSLNFSTLTIHISGDMPPIAIRNSSNDCSADLPIVQRVDLGHIAPGEGEGREYDGSLRWGAGGTIVFYGSVSCDVPATFKIERIVLAMKEGNWNIQIPLHTSGQKKAPYPRWLSGFDPLAYIPVRRDQYSAVTVRHRPHKVHVSVTYNAPAYIGEEFPIVIDVSNQDDKELEMVVDALLQPTEYDELGENYIRMGDERSTSLIKGVPLGTLAPGVSTSVILYLSSAGTVYDRVIDISVQSHREVPTSVAHEPESPGSPKSPSQSRVDRDEAIRTLVVPAVQPLSIEQKAMYRRSLKPSPGLADLMTYDDGFWDDGDVGEAIVTTTMVCTAPSGIMVDSIKLVTHDGRTAKIVDSSLDQVEDDFITEWLAGDEFCDRCRVSLAVRDDVPEGQDIPAPGTYELTWRRILPDGGHSTPASTRFSLPTLRPPRDGLVALLDVPPTAKLHTPFILRLIVRNRQPTRSANVVVHLETDNNDAFIVAGLRNGRLPIILPGGEETLLWKLVPIECGFVRIPRIRVSDRRTDPGAPIDEPHDRNVNIVDVRADERGGLQEDGTVEEVGLAGQPVILVLP
ncbi:Gryzun, putative trafficking through golgi-domain-containing protein [Fomitopsis betulina]|nr:Gryzun, putative trafficking through golgi-domain-containing protein [Fomitopsis betulina]